MEINRKKYYFLPFVDNILAILIATLFTMFFGSWFTFRPFGIFVGVILTLVMCGLFYSRMWKLSRKNTRYDLGLTRYDGIKFVLPVAIFSLLLVLFYILADKNIIPLREIVIKTYYTFPENAPRVPVDISYFDYFTMAVRVWFTYSLGLMQKTNIWVLLVLPFLMVLSGAVGFSLGAKNKEVLNEYLNVAEKVKKKFNE